jgi:hypothetical protein
VGSEMGKINQDQLTALLRRQGEGFYLQADF